MYLLDTNTCIFVLKNRSDKPRRKFKAIRNLAISSITYGELCFGIENGEPSLRVEPYNQLDTFTQRILIDPAILVTNNIREFCRVQDLTLEDWS